MSNDWIPSPCISGKNILMIVKKLLKSCLWVLYGLFDLFRSWNWLVSVCLIESLFSCYYFAGNFILHTIYCYIEGGSDISSSGYSKGTKTNFRLNYSADYSSKSYFEIFSINPQIITCFRNSIKIALLKHLG